MNKPRTSACIVPRSMGLVLRISRIFGVAPVWLEDRPDGCRVVFAPSLCIYGYAIIGVFSLITIIYAVINLSLPMEMTYRLRSSTRRMVHIADFILVTTLSIVGGYQAPAQMRRLSDYVNRVHKMIAELKTSNTNCLMFLDNRQYCYIVTFVLSLFVISIASYSTQIYLTILKNQDIWLSAAFISYRCSYVVIKLLEIQFILTAWHVLSVLNLINSKLRLIQKKCDLSTSHFISTTSNDLMKCDNQDQANNRIYPSAYTVSVQPKSINKTVDTLAIIKRPLKDQKPGEWKTDAETIRQLSITYCAVCDIIKEIDKDYGTVLVMLLASLFLHLIVTLYYSFTNIYSDPLDSPLWNKIVTPILELAWWIFHILCLIMLVEPCHRTQREMEITKELTNHLMCTMVFMDEPLPIELKMFSKSVLFNQITYSPLRVCTLTRSLIITILGNITTYLVVIIQMQE